MLKATYPINRYNVDCIAKLRKSGLIFAFHNDNEADGNNWYHLTIPGEAYRVIKSDLARLIYDKPASLGEIKKITLRTIVATGTNKAKNLALIIVPKTKHKDWFIFTIEDDSNIYLTFEMRKTELINIMDATTELFLD